MGRVVGFGIIIEVRKVEEEEGRRKERSRRRFGIIRMRERIN